MITATTLHALLTCAVVAAVGLLSIVVLPWTDEELDETEQAWHALTVLVASMAVRLRSLRRPPQVAAQPVRSAQAAWSR